MTSWIARTVLLLSLLAPPSPASAGRSSDDERRFPRLARVFLLPDEDALLKELRDDKDRATFQKIFWARRDPTPGTPANEFEDNVRAAWTQADRLFAYSNQKGSETGCGQVLALLGRPEEVLHTSDDPRQPSVAVTGTTSRERADPTKPIPHGPVFDSMDYLREGSRQPETWVYRERPGRPFRFTSAELRVAFDAECRYAEGAGTLGQDLRGAAAAYVVRPEIGYQRDGQGHLLAPSVAAAAPALALLSAPRNDLPLAVEPKLLMRGPKGDAYAAGIVRLSGAAAAAGSATRLSLAVQARDGQGQLVASATREVLVRPEPDGSLVAAFALSLKPGAHALTVAALLPDGDKGAVALLQLEVPDFAAGLTASPLILYPDEPALAASTDARDPLAPLQLGGIGLRPRFGNVYTTSDSLQVVATIYGAQVDPTTGQAALEARYSVLKAGKPVARGAEDVFTTKDAVASVGPIALATYEPGSYVVRLDVTDTAAGRTLRQEATFEVRKP